MKKYLLGSFAFALALSLSAFTSAPKKGDLTVNWFRAAFPHNYVTTTTSLDAPPGECSATGEGCLEGFIEASHNETYPGGTPNKTYKD